MIRSHQPMSTVNINRGVPDWVDVPYGDAIEGDEVFHMVRWPLLATEGEAYLVYSESSIWRLT